MTIKLSGCFGFGPDRKQYFSRLKLVEVQESFFFPPRLATVERWRQNAPRDFLFAVRAWQLITHQAPAGGYPRIPKSFGKLDYSQCGGFAASEPVAEAVRRTLEVADALEARALVFETPADFTPTVTNRSKLTRFFESLERGNRMLVWDPQGLWARDEISRICDDLDLVPSMDPTVDTEQPLGERAYLRLKSPRYTEDQLITIADAMSFAHEALCLWNTANMFKDAQRLQALLPSEY